ncbi:MAG: hypothetical protein GY932_11310 [Arcobacter sp.]|nr:hypothetical protein [Arcobacter sp.]
MILNLSKIKTEALLLFCKDLISSYRDNDEKIFDIDEETYEYIIGISNDIFKQLNNVTCQSDYYIQNKKHFRIKAILKSYNFINKEVSKEFEKNTGKVFNPAMLYFSLLAVWFKELDKERTSKEYIYFIIYPYSKVYDKLLVNIKDENFKNTNISMIELAERVIYKLDKLSLK